MEKIEFLKLVLKERKPGVINPIAFCDEQEINKYNLKDDDFIMIIDEEPYVALALGSRSWIIKADLNEKELFNIIKREKYKLNLIQTYGKIPMRYLKGNWTSSWETYESCCEEFFNSLKNDVK